jgi:heme-degrading monooxygenase HmoA
MIVEHAQLSVQPGRDEEFAAAFPDAQDVISRADGFRWLQLHRGIESSSTYLLLVGWDSVEHHMVGFRESPRFAQWRAIVGPFFAQPPVVEHFVRVAGGMET